MQPEGKKALEDIRKTEWKTCRFQKVRYEDCMSCHQRYNCKDPVFPISFRELPMNKEDAVKLIQEMASYRGLSPEEVPRICNTRKKIIEVIFEITDFNILVRISPRLERAVDRALRDEL